MIRCEACANVKNPYEDDLIFFARNALFIDSNTDELIRHSSPNEKYIVIELDTLRLQTEIGELRHLLG